MRACEVAKAFRVTTQTIGNWAKKDGCPVEFVDHNDGRWFDLAKMRAWVSANRPEVLSKKNGGGRPRKIRAGDAGGGGGDVPRGTSSIRTTSQGRGVRDDAPLLSHRVDEDPVDAPAQAGGAGGGGAVSAIVFEKTRLARVQAEQKELDLAKSRGELLNRNRVEAAIVSAARNIGGLCATMSQRLAAEIVGRASLPAGMFPVIEEMIRIECDGLVDAMLSNPLGDAIAVGGGNPDNEARAAA